MGLDLTTSAGGWFEGGGFDPCVLCHEINRLYWAVDLMHGGHVSLVLAGVALEHCLPLFDHLGMPCRHVSGCPSPD